MNKLLICSQVINISDHHQLKCNFETLLQTLTYFKRGQDKQDNSNKIIKILHDLKLLDILVQATRKTGEKGYKCLSENLSHENKTILLKGSERMTTSTEGIQRKFRFIPLANLSKASIEFIKKAEKTFKSFYNNSLVKLEDDLQQDGQNLMRLFAFKNR